MEKEYLVGILWLSLSSLDELPKFLRTVTSEDQRAFQLADFKRQYKFLTRTHPPGQCFWTCECESPQEHLPSPI